MNFFKFELPANQVSSSDNLYFHGVFVFSFSKDFTWTL